MDESHSSTSRFMESPRPVFYRNVSPDHTAYTSTKNNRDFYSYLFTLEKSGCTASEKINTILQVKITHGAG